MNSMWIVIALVAIAMLITRAKEAYAYKWRGLPDFKPAPAPGQMNEWGQRYGSDVQLFTGKRFDGMRTDFPGGPPGEANQYANVLAYRPDGDNAVRSMRVPVGHVVRVYTEPNFQGRSGVFAAGDHRLSWRWANNIASLVVVQGDLRYVTSGPASAPVVTQTQRNAEYAQLNAMGIAGYGAYANPSLAPIAWANAGPPPPRPPRV